MWHRRAITLVIAALLHLAFISIALQMRTGSATRAPVPETVIVWTGIQPERTKRTEPKPTAKVREGLRADGRYTSRMIFFDCAEAAKYGDQPEKKRGCRWLLIPDFTYHMNPTGKAADDAYSAEERLLWAKLKNKYDPERVAANDTINDDGLPIHNVVDENHVAGGVNMAVFFDIANRIRENLSE